MIIGKSRRRRYRYSRRRLWVIIGGAMLPTHSRLYLLVRKQHPRRVVACHHPLVSNVQQPLLTVQRIMEFSELSTLGFVCIFRRCEKNCLSPLMSFILPNSLHTQDMLEFKSLRVMPTLALVYTLPNLSNQPTLSFKYPPNSHSPSNLP